MLIERTSSNALEINSLPDGSRVIVDRGNDRIYALNPTAGAAWDACTEPTTLRELAVTMQQHFNSETTEEVAHEAILQLASQGLVATSEPQPSRRQFMAGLTAVALPLVVSLTVADQQAHAAMARSVMPSRTRDPFPFRNNPSPVRRGPDNIHFR